jgi:hypothetical protein
MPGSVQKPLGATLPRGRFIVGRCAATALTIVALACFAGVSGCNRGPAGLVPVSGKLTLDGGAWPKAGQINFSPVKAEKGHPILPAMARINEDGTFEIKTEAAPGLVPGQYNAAILCWLESPDDRGGGKSAVADLYRSPLTSGLKVDVPEGSPPIKLNWDIKSK